MDSKEKSKKKGHRVNPFYFFSFGPRLVVRSFGSTKGGTGFPAGEGSEARHAAEVKGDGAFLYLKKLSIDAM